MTTDIQERTSEAALRHEMPRPTGDIAQARRDLDETGLAIMRGLFSKAQIDALRERLVEQAEQEREQGVAFFADPKLGPHPVKGNLHHQPGSRIGRPLHDPPFQSIRFLGNKGQDFIRLCETPEFLALSEHVFADAFMVSSISGVIIRGGAQAQLLHRDQAVLPFETPRPVLMNIMVALGPYTEEMGATLFAPGTHRGPGPRYSAGPDGAIGVEGDVRTFPAEMQAGDACLFDSRVWHGQGPSRSSEPRLSISLIYCAHWWKPHENYVATLSDDVYRGMSEAQRALFGFQMIRFGTGFVAPRTAEDPRHNIGTELPYVPELHRDGPLRAHPVNGEVEVW